MLEVAWTASKDSIQRAYLPLARGNKAIHSSIKKEKRKETRKWGADESQRVIS
jgi:hypothetical protein